MHRNRSLLFIVAGIVAVAAVLWLVPRAQQARAPNLVRAWVGVEVDGDGVARTGLAEVAADQEFRLHAIVEVEVGGAGGESVYYSAAPQVVLDGQRLDTMPAEELGGFGRVRLLWFSVEAGVPFRELEHGADLEKFSYEQIFRPEWGSTWSIDGTLDAYFDTWLERDGPDIERDFGTLRYQVWVEGSTDEDALVPDQRVKSAALPGATRIVARLASALEHPSALFGLPQLERGDGEWNAASLEKLQQLYEDGLAFSRLGVLRGLLDAGGTRWEDLRWELAALDGSVPWHAQGDGSPAPGDLVSVADRWVVLLEDRVGDGEQGMLDGADLCLDFDAGAVVRRLDQIFVLGGEGEGDVMVAALRSPA